MTNSKVMTLPEENTSDTAVRQDRRRSQVIVAFSINILVAIIVFFGSFFAGNKFFFTIVRINGSSMAPTLADGDLYVLNRLVYKMRSPHLGEVVVFKDPEDSMLSIKRVVAGPGDTIVIRDGVVYRNNTPLTEPYLNKNTKTYTYDPEIPEVLVLKENEFYLLGDNRENSLDSRSYGGVPRQFILGAINRS